MRILWKICPQRPAALPSLQLCSGLEMSLPGRKTGAVGAIQALQLFPSSLLCSRFPQRLRTPHPCLVWGQGPPLPSKAIRELQVTSATHPGLRPPGAGSGGLVTVA